MLLALLPRKYSNNAAQFKDLNASLLQWKTQFKSSS